MSIGVFLTARLGSSRLPRKHLLPAGANCMLGVLLERIEYAFKGEVRTVITTSDEPENREFERFQSMSATVFYGSLTNIPLRHLQAAQALGIKHIVAVDGDDIFCSSAAMRQVRDALATGSDYAKTDGLPLGLNAFGYSADFLEKSMQGWTHKTLETGWGRIFEYADVTSIELRLAAEAPETLRFTLDYPEDLAFFQALVSKLDSRLLCATDDEVVSCVIKNELFRLTDPVSQRYWKDFAAVKAKEIVSDEQ